MASLQEILEAPIPRPLLWIGTPILAFALILSFVFLGFPYSDFIPVASQTLERSSGGEIHIGEIRPHITLGGPGFSVHDVSVGTKGQAPVQLDSLAIRPAWSTSWLRREPSFVIDLVSPAFLADGTLTLGEASRFEGKASILDLAQIPLPAGSPVTLTGAIAAEGHLSLRGSEPEGMIIFEAGAGSATHRSVPMPLDYERISGRIEIGGEAWLALHKVQLEGPVFSATADGYIDRPQGNAPAPIDIGVKLEVTNLPFRMLLTGLGLRLDGAGRTAFNLGGTLQDPAVR